MAGLKEMAPTFWAFDRTTYCKLIPDHISDLKTFPPEVLHSFMQGCFSVTCTECISHVALDEAHKMEINKGTKQLVVCPAEENMHRISCVMHYRSKIHEMVKHIVKVGDSELGQSNHLPDKVSTKNYYTLVKVENNVLRMQESLRQSRMFEAVDSNRGLVNFLAKIKASPEQEKDLLNFHSVGQKDYEGYVDYCILRVHATTGTQRRRRLTTFSTKQKERKRVKQIEKQKKNLEK